MTDRGHKSCETCHFYVRRVGQIHITEPTGECRETNKPIPVWASYWCRQWNPKEKANG